ncbi:hypothetical protein N6G95_08455 [Pediococcus inopinatus]|uniref:hypothetical protein n=1 Tax=Pediococcus inopinatus TaxID=114090 RepID=UPI000A50197C|nr:hypothetical protein [Pediococcus inopinatus]WPC19255.1 hypothetical protein N6G95_08455 [Pediococcus inopinatus]
MKIQKILIHTVFRNWKSILIGIQETLVSQFYYRILMMLFVHELGYKRNSSLLSRCHFQNTVYAGFLQAFIIGLPSRSRLLIIAWKLLASSMELAMTPINNGSLYRNTNESSAPFMGVSPIHYRAV